MTVKHPLNYLPVYWKRKHPSIESTQPSGHTPGAAGVVAVLVVHLGVVAVVSHPGVVVSHTVVVVNSAGVDCHRTIARTMHKIIKIAAYVN